MANRAFQFAMIVSAVLFAVVLVLSVVSLNVDPSHQRLSFGQEFHVSVVAYRSHPRIVFFNDPEGPYGGSITHLAGNPPPYDRRVAFGETAGIYYRYFHWKGGGESWTLSVSMAYPAVVFGILPGAWLFRRARRRWVNSQP